MNEDTLLGTCEEFIPVSETSAHTEDELLTATHFIQNPIDADKTIKDSVERLVDAKNVESAIEKNEKAFNDSVHQSYIDMDEAFLTYLINFNATVEKQESLKLCLKKQFFYFIMLFMGLVITFPYIMVYMFRDKVTDVTIITLSIASLAEILSAIIVLPKIIAKYLFNKKEEDNKIKIISDMQAYNKEKRCPTANNS